MTNRGEPRLIDAALNSSHVRELQSGAGLITSAKEGVAYGPKCRQDMPEWP